MLSNEEFLVLEAKETGLKKYYMKVNTDILNPAKTNQDFKLEDQGKNVKTANPGQDISVIINKITLQHDIDTEKKNNFKQENLRLQSPFHSSNTQITQQKDELNNKQNFKNILKQKNINLISKDEYQKIVNENCQLVEIILNLKDKLKALQNRNRIKLDKIIQENEEKDKEIYELKKQIKRIKSLLQQKNVEMKERCSKIQSISNDFSLYQMQLESNSNIENDKKDQEIKQLNQRNESLKKIIYDLTQKNKPN